MAVRTAYTRTYNERLTSSSTLTIHDAQTRVILSHCLPEWDAVRGAPRLSAARGEGPSRPKSSATSDVSRCVPEAAEASPGEGEYGLDIADRPGNQLILLVPPVPLAVRSMLVKELQGLSVSAQERMF